MATIPTTTLGTSAPIDVCRGFYLFAGDNARALRLGFQSGQTLLAVSPQILLWRFNSGVGYNFFMGVCRPPWAGLFKAQGETSGNRIQLAIRDDETAAGFLVGFSITLFVELGLEEYRIRWIADGWNSRFAGEWTRALNATLAIKLDLVDLLISYIL